MPAMQPRLRMGNLKVSNFKCFRELELEFDRGSELGGEWTCIAGVNGAGKSSVLQAVAMVMLNLGFAMELGRTRLAGMARRVEGGGGTSIESELNRAGEWILESFDFAKGGLRDEGLAGRMLVLGYGASRNVAPELNQRMMGYSVELKRVLSLFEPFAPLSNSEAFFRNAGETPSGFLELFGSAMKRLFPEELAVLDLSTLSFSVRGAAVTIEELPDGYRSSLAWLSDLCWNWARVRPTSVDPAEVEALVLIDEIDLHLHPQLQRSLVPRLREIFPNVQWIVTTHSPLVLGCFDKNEIILLDSDCPNGVELVERQVMGLTADQIVSKLMGTQPSGAALEEKLRVAEGDASLREAAVSMIDNEQGREPLMSPAQVSAMLDQLTR